MVAGSPSGAVGKVERQELSLLQAQPSSDLLGMWEDCNSSMVIFKMLSISNFCRSIKC